MSNRIFSLIKKSSSIALSRFNSPNDFKKNFFILGAQKAGTTALFEILRTHPELNPSIRKEVNFFNKDFTFNKGIGWYVKQYEPLNIKKINYEASPSYFHKNYVAVRIKKFFPNAKFLLLLREPVSRAYSSWNMYKILVNSEYQRRQLKNFHFKNGNRDDMLILEELLSYKKNFPSFEELIKEELNNPQFANDSLGTRILRMGCYDNQITNYLKHFSLEQFLIIESNDLKENTKQIFEKIEDFLSVPSLNIKDNFQREYHKRTYSSSINSKTKMQLKQYYKPHNKRLYELIGEKFNWS